MKKFTITTQTSYTKNGEEKKTYPQVGKMTYFPKTEDKKEGYILELNMFPNTKFYVFEDTPKDVVKDDETGEMVPKFTTEQKKEMTVDDIASLEEIPF